MIEKHLDIATPDGAMNTFVVHPEEEGPHPVVLFYMDAPGKREELHDMARRIQCETYVACAETDIWAPPEAIAQLQAALQAAGTPHRIEWYPGAHHGFVFPRREGIYHQPSAERHWERLFSLFRRAL